MQLVADQVKGKRIADIGCDHGKIITYLLVNNLIDYAICSDISAPSVAKAEALLKQHNIDDKCWDIRCGDGLKTISCEDKIDEVIMSGLGGREISKIISQSDIKARLILQPQHNEIDLKRYLVSHGYNIVFDKIVYDMSKFYNVFVAEQSDEVRKYNDYELYFGKDNFTGDNHDLRKYILFLENKYKNIVDIVPEDTRLEVQYMLQLIDKAKKEIGE